MPVKLIADSNDNTDYAELLESIKAPKHPLKAAISGVPTLAMWSNKAVLVRHDIDYRMDHALEFARAEAAMGCHATYFLLHTANYFDYSKVFGMQVAELHDLGHEVGLHSSFISDWYVNGGKCEPERPIKFLRDHAFPVVGTAAHGDRLCYEHDFVNYEVWKECQKPREKPGPWPKFNLSDFGLAYEAYSLHRDAYLTDTGHHWKGALRFMPLFERWSDPLSKEQTIEGFNAMDNTAIMQLLVHPIWWKVEK
jgi:hypothetical protein